MVMRHRREEMVSHVRIGDIVENLIQQPIIPIHRGQSTPQPIPFGRVIVGQRRVSMLQVRYQNQKAIRNEQWNPIDACEPSQPSSHGDPVKHKSRSENSSIGDENLQAFPVRVYGAVGIEMAGETLVAAAGNIEGQIQRPAQSESEEEREKPSRGAVQVLGVEGESGSGLGDEHFVAVERGGVGVVAAVTVFPREVRDEQSRVEEEADGIIHPLVIAEGMVAAFMSNHPNTGQNAALGDPIERPRKVRARKERKKRGGNAVQQRSQEDVGGNVREGADERALEAMDWNSFLDLPQAERRRFVRCSLEDWRFLLPMIIIL